MLKFKRELRILNEHEHLINTITAADNPECNFMISNQHFACNFVSSPIGSLLTKLRQMGEKCYCCKKDVVATKIHNLKLKLTFFVLGKEKATSNKTEKHCQSFSITLM